MNPDDWPIARLLRRRPELAPWVIFGIILASYLAGALIDGVYV